MSCDLRYDDRPLPTLLLARCWRGLVVTLVLAGIVAVQVWTANRASDDGLSQAGIRVLAVFLGAVTLWVTAAVPLVVTALGVFIGLVATGIDTPAAIATWYWRDIVFFLLGAFLIAGSLSAAHVVDHAALRLIDLLGGGPRRLRFVLFWSAFLAACLMSEHAVMAMLFPIAKRIGDALGRKPGSSTYVRGLFFALAWGATIGGIVTYLGGARNALAMGFLVEAGHEPVGFFRLMAYSLPVALPLGVIACVVLAVAFPVDLPDISAARTALAERRRELGRFGPRQLAVTGLLLVAIAGWAFAGYKLIAVVAITVAAALLATGLVKWRDLAKEVPWDLLLLYGSALALAKALELTGAHRLAAESLIPALKQSPLLTMSVIAALAMLLTEAMSNAAVVSILVPLILGFAVQVDLNPVHATMAVALPAGLAFMLPMGSPPLAIAFASGEFRLSTMLLWGGLLNLLALPLVVLAWWLVWPA